MRKINSRDRDIRTHPPLSLSPHLQLGPSSVRAVQLADSVIDIPYPGLHCRGTGCGLSRWNIIEWKVAGLFVTACRCCSLTRMGYRQRVGFLQLHDRLKSIPILKQSLNPCSSPYIVPCGPRGRELYPGKKGVRVRNSLTEEGNVCAWYMMLNVKTKALEVGYSVDVSE